MRYAPACELLPEPSSENDAWHLSFPANREDSTMRVAIVTLPAFNELDSLIAFGVLKRIKRSDWRVIIASPTPEVISMNGLPLRAEGSLEDARLADAVIVGSGGTTREIVQDAALMQQLAFRPAQQLIGAQCSGALILAKLGVLGDNVPACTDHVTKPWVQEAGVQVLDQPFFASGNVATAGGCLASSYLAGWIIARSIGLDAAAEALHYVAPVGEKEAFVINAIRNIEPYLPAS